MSINHFIANKLYNLHEDLYFNTNTNENSAFVTEQSGINSGGKLTINVEGKTKLKGATIASDTGDMSLTTDSIEYEDQEIEKRPQA